MGDSLGGCGSGLSSGGADSGGGRPAGPIEDPTAGAKMEDLNPILWTWFIIAIMVAVTMICVIFFSMWVYSQR